MAQESAWLEARRQGGKAPWEHGPSDDSVADPSVLADLSALMRDIEAAWSQADVHRVQCLTRVAELYFLDLRESAANMNAAVSNILAREPNRPRDADLEKIVLEALSKIGEPKTVVVEEALKDAPEDKPITKRSSGSDRPSAYECALHHRKEFDFDLI